jgi:polysaccharide chain length determinant protein (PEP-CTERM system associated)
MINPEKSFNIHDYIEIFLRRIWYIVIPFVIIGVGTVIYIFITPKEYRATSVILVTPQEVPEAFVRPTVTSRIEARLQSISEEIMSRTQLEKVISEFKLYPDLVKSKGTEEIVEKMRKDIKIQIRGNPERQQEGKQQGAFTISYTGKNPIVVTRVTNKLASLIIEENLKVREKQAQGTSEFLSVELGAKKAKLEEQEKTITNFKRQYSGELPEQRDANAKVLEQLTLLYQRVGETLGRTQDRKLIIQKQISDTELLLASYPNTKEGITSLGNPFKDPQVAQLEQLKMQLADYQAKYTEKHPDIVTIKKRIAELEAKIEKDKSEKKTEESIAVSELPEPNVGAKKQKKDEKSELRLNPRYKEIEAQLIAVDLEIARLKEEEEKIKAQINRYRERVENTPIREQAMANITRDYLNTKESYQSLERKSQEALQAENLERRQKGEQFKVIDPARVPMKPVSPDIPKILLFGLMLGLGGGFGMAFLKEQTDHSFRDAEDLEAALGFKVLTNIPKIEKKAA